MIIIQSRWKRFIAVEWQQYTDNRERENRDEMCVKPNTIEYFESLARVFIFLSLILFNLVVRFGIERSKIKKQHRNSARGVESWVTFCLALATSWQAQAITCLGFFHIFSVNSFSILYTDINNESQTHTLVHKHKWVYCRPNQTKPKQQKEMPRNYIVEVIWGRITYRLNA